MPSENEHVQKTLHNFEVIKYLLAKPEFCDWTATVIFYTALHIVEAVFFYDTKHSKERHGQSHENREKILKNTKSYQNIHRHYRPLQSASVIARYLSNLGKDVTNFQQYMTAQQVQELLIKHHLAQVIKSACKFLSENTAKLVSYKFNETFQ